MKLLSDHSIFARWSLFNKKLILYWMILFTAFSWGCFTRDAGVVSEALRKARSASRLDQYLQERIAGLDEQKEGGGRAKVKLIWVKKDANDQDYHQALVQAEEYAARITPPPTLPRSPQLGHIQDPAFPDLPEPPSRPIVINNRVSSTSSSSVIVNDRKGYQGQAPIPFTSAVPAAIYKRQRDQEAMDKMLDRMKWEAQVKETKRERQEIMAHYEKSKQEAAQQRRWMQSSYELTVASANSRYSSSKSQAVENYLRSKGWKKIKIATTNWPNGHKKSRFESFEDRMEAGLMRKWYENGRLAYEGYEKEGKGHGGYRRYYKSGSKMFEGTYRDGNIVADRGWKPDGSVSPTKVIEGNGVCFEYFENGNLLRKEVYLNGLLHNLCEQWYDNGNLYRGVSYFNGLKNGAWEEYYYDGTIRTKGRYKKDRMDGSWIQLNESSTPLWKGSFVNGKPNQKFTFWRSDSTIESLIYKEGGKPEYVEPLPPP
jgi:antitoxin component YwqK of YwqJK toxin-antitoxin module